MAASGGRAALPSSSLIHASMASRGYFQLWWTLGFLQVMGQCVFWGFTWLFLNPVPKTSSLLCPGFAGTAYPTEAATKATTLLA